MHEPDIVLDKFEGAMVFSAIGDALGWPTELGRHSRHISDFVVWKKAVGGRYFGFEETIKAGSYSDDTQLTLSTARCIDEKGNFDPDTFAYLELPLWQDYERGGGRAVKAAAALFSKKQREWFDAFYKIGDLEYRNAGGNGAAMRMLPLALVNANDGNKLLRDIFISSVITHGHPRAILGAIIYSSLINFTLKQRELQRKTVQEYLRQITNTPLESLKEYPWFERWLDNWNKRPLDRITFEHHFQKAQEEALRYIEAISTFIDSPDVRYYQLTGALNRVTRGSGLSTVSVATYLLLKYIYEPEKALLTAVNMAGSDTDTIASFVGGLFGSLYGRQAIKKNLIDNLQDKEYILKVAGRLYKIASREILQESILSRRLEWQDFPLIIKAWQIGLFGMFWDALEKEDIVTHPVLGRGKITRKEVKPVQRDDYIAKLVEASFDCGQSCVFHSRVRKELSSILAGEFPKEETPEERLKHLIEKGLIRGPAVKFEDFHPLKIPGSPLSKLLEEIRSEPNE